MRTRRVSAPRYKMVPLCHPRPWMRFFPCAISPSGHFVAGNTVTRWGKEARWSLSLWSDGEWIDVPDEQHVALRAVNDAGDMIGRVPLFGKFPWHAVLCRPATATIERLLLDDTNNDAQAIDNAGNIYGVRLGGQDRFARAFVKRSDAVIDFPDTEPNRSSYVAGANEKQQVLLELFAQNPKRSQRGIWNTAPSERPFEDIFFELQSLVSERSSRAFAMNNHGDVVGFGEGEDKMYRPVLWRRGAKEPVLLWDDKAGTADGINDHGDIIGKLFQVGTRGRGTPFLMHQGTFYLLNDLVDSMLHVEAAQRILNDGSILATVRHKYASPLDHWLPTEFLAIKYTQRVLLKPR